MDGLVSPGQTMNIGSADHLTQIQHKGDRVEIVDHFDHDSIPFHLVTRVTRDGSVDTNAD
jgi:hypothetical protein